METVSSKHIVTEDKSIPEHKETSPLSSETKITNNKRRSEEDLHTAQGSGEGIAGGSSVTSSIKSRTSPEDQEKEATLHPQKRRRLDSEPSGLDEVGDHNTGSSSISSTVAVAPATEATVPPVSTPSLPLTPTPHATLVQVSAPAADPPTEGSSGDTALDAVPLPPSFPETQKYPNTRLSKKPRLDIELTATNPIPSSLSTLDCTEPLAAVIPDANATLQLDAFPKPSPFVVLPVELLSEILIYTRSPQHVLAVARTCKALCQTLLSLNNQFIWKGARRALTFQVDAPGESAPLPDPPKDFFGEAAYAAFVFDSGVCEACGKQTNMMYASFALRARLCKNLKCRNSAIASLDLTRLPARDLHVARVVPVIESDTCLTVAALAHDSPLVLFNYANSAVNLCRSSDWEDARDWIENAPRDDAFNKKYERARARQIKWQEFTLSLHKWKCARQYQYHILKAMNESQSKNFASKFGWDRTDMINSTVYGLYYRQKIQVMEKVRETDVIVMKDQIESQLLALSGKRDRHTAEVIYLKNRSDIEKHYHTLRSNKSFPFLPSLLTFRQLPIIQLLQSAPRAEGITISQTLQSNALMRGLLSNQLKQWAQGAREDFAILLGFSKNWKNPSSNVLHPVERVTARFLCIHCGVKAKDRGNRTDDGSLDFVGACKHVCNDSGGKAKKGRRGKWDASKFVKDEKAINALKKMIQILDYAEDKDGPHMMINLGLAVLCTSCDPPMILDARGVIGHSHRHDAMELSLSLSVDKVASYLGGYPFSFGLTEKLMGPEHLAFLGKKAIESKNYGCRHCLRAKQAEPAAAAENEGGDEEGSASNPESLLVEVAQVQLSTIAISMHSQGIQGPREKPPPLFNFNGMISHLKAKHRIESIRDEDFLCYDAISL